MTGIFQYFQHTKKTRKKHLMRNNCFVFPDFFSRNVGNSIKCEKNITPPPPQTTPTFEIRTREIEDIMDIDSNCPYLLPVFGETTSHLTSKLNVMDGGTDRRGVSIFFNVENSIKREIKKNCFSKKTHPPPPPRIFFFMLEIAWNAKKTWNISIFKKFIQNSDNIPSISKTIQHTPMTWCTYLQSFEKIHQCVFELQCEN